MGTNPVLALLHYINAGVIAVDRTAIEKKIAAGFLWRPLRCIDLFEPINILFFFVFPPQLTWVDIYFAAVMDVFSGFAGFDLIENYSNLQSVVSNVTSIDSIKAWIDSRPATDY